MSAVGYGDIVPDTQCGRAVTTMAAFLGIIITAVLVAAVHQLLNLLPYEHRMVDFLEKNVTIQHTK